MNEFEFIRERLAPLARGVSGARDLTDDAATLSTPSGHELIVTADALVGGEHFLEDDPLDAVAAKALRVNLSDLAAKGGAPLGYLLAIVWPRGALLADKERFVAGLAADQERFGIGLLGGDTTVGPGPLTIAITALGSAPAGGFVARAGARPGDGLFVTGTIGDAGLGLKALKGELPDVAPDHAEALVRRYRLPEPRLAVAESLRRHARAAIDVSDGLLADAGHLAATSGVGVAIEAERLPLSAAARSWAEGRAGASAAATLATSGDDYEILFAATDEGGEAIGLESGVAVTRIGTVDTGSGVRLIGPEGAEISIERAGFTHF